MISFYYQEVSLCLKCTYDSLNLLRVLVDHLLKFNKACFAHNSAYSDSKDLTKRTVADKILRNRAFNIAKDPKYDWYQSGLASMVYKFFDKKSAGNGVVIIKLTPQNQQLAE